jgi:hypothetical protein
LYYHNQFFPIFKQPNQNTLARQLNTKLTGTKGNLSFYKMYDTYYVRTKSQGGKQTQRTKAKQKILQ